MATLMASSDTMFLFVLGAGMIGSSMLLRIQNPASDDQSAAEKRTAVHKKHLFTTIAFMVLMAGGPVALRADSFNWTDIGSGISTASGTLSAHSVGGGEYIVDSGSAMFNGDSMTLVAGLDNGTGQISPSGLFIYNNVLYLSSDLTLDVDGLLFADSQGNELNIWGNGSPGSYSTYTEVGGSYILQDNFSIFSITPASAVPEPSVLVLLGVGMMVTLMGFAWRRHSQTVGSRS